MTKLEKLAEDYTIEYLEHDVFMTDDIRRAFKNGYNKACDDYHTYMTLKVAKLLLDIDMTHELTIKLAQLLQELDMRNETT